MNVSPVGLTICALLFFAGRLAGGSVLAALIASSAFGATAFVTFGARGSSPLIYAFFVILLVASVALRRRLLQDIGAIFSLSYATWTVCTLMVYALVGTLLFPRLFAGQTSVFVASRSNKGVFEVPLAPVSGNLTQTGYLILGGITFLAVCIVLLRARGFDDVRRGFFLWCTLHTGLGLVDLCAKLTGLGDILAPIRTANYVMLTEASQSGFVRITGAQSEASAFGGVSLAALAFAFTYWRKTYSPICPRPRPDALRSPGAVNLIDGLCGTGGAERSRMPVDQPLAAQRTTPEGRRLPVGRAVRLHFRDACNGSV